MTFPKFLMAIVHLNFKFVLVKVLAFYIFLRIYPFLSRLSNLKLLYPFSQGFSDLNFKHQTYMSGIYVHIIIELYFNISSETNSPFLFYILKWFFKSHFHLQNQKTKSFTFVKQHIYVYKLHIHHSVMFMVDHKYLLKKGIIELFLVP